MPRSSCLALAMLLALMLLSACGQKGALYRPEEARFQSHSRP